MAHPLYVHKLWVAFDRVVLFNYTIKYIRKVIKWLTYSELAFVYWELTTIQEIWKVFKLFARMQYFSYLSLLWSIKSSINTAIVFMTCNFENLKMFITCLSTTKLISTFSKNLCRICQVLTFTAFVLQLTQILR